MISAASHTGTPARISRSNAFIGLLLSLSLSGISGERFGGKADEKRQKNNPLDFEGEKNKPAKSVFIGFSG
jgi:hypothetical protein